MATDMSERPERPDSSSVLLAGHTLTTVWGLLSACSSRNNFEALISAEDCAEALMDGLPDLVFKPDMATWEKLHEYILQSLDRMKERFPLSSKQPKS